MMTPRMKSDPEVAYGYSEYGIAYLMDDEVWVTFFRYDGIEINTYRISDGTGEASYSCDIAFEGSSGLFVVAWQNYDYSSYDVLSRAVHPQMGPQGSIVSVADTSEAEMGPSLDCNHNDGSCLVAFNYHDGYDAVKGRFMNVSSSGVSAPSHSAFIIINNGEYTRELSVAWGWNAGTYGIIVQVYMGLDPSYGLYTHVYDTYQSGGDQMPHNPIYLTPTDWTDYDIIPTDLTYDPCTQNYLALFSHPYNGDDNDHDIYMKPFSADSTFKISDPIKVSYTSNNEHSGAISFMTNAWAAQFGIVPDEIAVTYEREPGFPYGIMTTIIKGNCTPASPEYTVVNWWQHMSIRTTGAITTDIGEPAVSGSGGNGEYMVTWTDDNSGINTNSDDIFGMILRSEKLFYLPLLLK